MPPKKSYPMVKYSKKKNKTEERRITVLEKQVKVLKPETKYFQSGIPVLKFAEWHSPTGDSFSQIIAFAVPKQGIGANDRIGDKIRIERVEMTCEIQGNQLISDVPYSMDFFLYKEMMTAPLTLSNTLTIYQADDYGPATPGNGVSTRSFPNIEKKQDLWQKLASINGTAKSYNTLLTNYVKSHKMTIRKPFNYQYNFNQNTGQPIDLVKNAFVVVWRAGGMTDANFANQTMRCNNFTLRFYYTDS